MDSEELIARYKLLPLWGRLVVGAFIGIIPFYFSYLEDGEILEEQLMNIEGQLGAIQAKFDREKKKRDKLPELEARLSFTQQNLKESSKRLPDDFMMDSVLQETASLANDASVELTVFDPSIPVEGKGAFKYMELPISLEIVGSFQQIAGFYDRIVNMEKMVHVRKIRIMFAKAEFQKNGDLINTQKMTDAQIQRLARDNVKLVSTASMVIYRAMTALEEGLVRSSPGKRPPKRVSQRSAQPGAEINNPTMKTISRKRG